MAPFELSSNRLLPDLFWHLADLGPWLLAALVVLLPIARFRQAVLVSLTAGLISAALSATVFHYTYTTVIWAGHKDAIRSLDQSALSAGFAAGAAAAFVLTALHRLLRGAGKRYCV